eukprot:3812441-Rhodomonas_salina.3
MLSCLQSSSLSPWERIRRDPRALILDSDEVCFLPVSSASAVRCPALSCSQEDNPPEPEDIA